MKTLSIIIPQYNETEQDMFALLSILNLQEDCDFDDFDVTIVNDCSDVEISDEYLAQFKNLHINTARMAVNGGCGLARQFGVDHTESEYVMFIDADDLVYSITTITKLLRQLKEHRPDVLRGYYLQEAPATDGSFRFLKYNAITWVHSKVYKREYLEKYKITFPDYRVNEDGYFNTVVFNLPADVLDVDDFMIIYRFNKNSITRQDASNFFTKSQKYMFLGKDDAFEKCKHYMTEEDQERMAIQILTFFYFQAQTRTEEDLEPFAENYKYIYNKYKWCLKNERTFLKYYQDMRLNMYNDPYYKERETFEQFWKKYE